MEFINLTLKENKRLSKLVKELMALARSDANEYKLNVEKDTITIKTYAKDGRCNIEVRDTGIGISDEGLKRVFDRFYREDKARSRVTGGTGLGLSIAHTIVSKHKGTIKAMHNEPKGTIILVRIWFIFLL